MSHPNLQIPALFNVEGKIALVTGGGSGIGLMIATALVQNGAKVYISSRKEKQLKPVAEALTKKGPGSCQYFVTDLVTKAGVDSLADHIKSKESKLDILANVSGATWGDHYENFPEKEGWDRVFNLNVKSMFYLTAALTPLLVKDANNLSPSRVINISSVSSIEPRVEGSPLAAPGHGLWSYNVSKAAVNHLTSIQAVHLGPKHVTVNAILPGLFPSKMTAYGIKNSGEQMAAAQPTGRYGSSEDMAGLVLFLVSPAGSHVTGAQISLDGGATLAGPRFANVEKAKL